MSDIHNFTTGTLILLKNYPAPLMAKVNTKNCRGYNVDAFDEEKKIFSKNMNVTFGQIYMKKRKKKKEKDAVIS